MMLTKGDDYPIHQTPEPIAYAGSDRNFYDRYFFNGYSPDGAEFVAVAFGVYPALNVAGRVICMLEGRIVLEGEAASLDRDRVVGAYFGLKQPA